MDVRLKIVYLCIEKEDNLCRLKRNTMYITMSAETLYHADSLFKCFMRFFYIYYSPNLRGTSSVPSHLQRYSQ